jgi:hypothetical protein
MKDRFISVKRWDPWCFTILELYVLDGAFHINVVVFYCHGLGWILIVEGVETIGVTCASGDSSSANSAPHRRPRPVRIPIAFLQFVFDVKD